MTVKELITLAMRKEDLYKLIDKIPVENLPIVEKVLKEMTIPIEKLTDEEEKAIKAGKREVEQGEFYSLDDLKKLIEEGND